MKQLKFILAIVIAAIAFGACSNDLEHFDTRNSIKLRSQAEAINIAINAHSAFYNKDTRSSDHKIIADNGVHVIKGRSSRGLNDDTLLYVVNYESNEGFAVVSASPTTEPLIGIAEEGNYSPELCNVNPNFNFYLNKVSEYIGSSMESNAIVGPIGPGYPSPDSLIFTHNYRVLESKGPYVELKWGQKLPYGRLFRNGYCGSVPTVVGMIAAHFKWPSKVYIDGRFDEIDWHELSQHKYNGEGCLEADSATIHRNMGKAIHFIASQLTTYMVNDSIEYANIGSLVLDRLTGKTGECFYTEELETTEQVVNCIRYYDGCPNTLVYAIEDNPTTTAQWDNLIKHSWLIDGYKTIQNLHPNAQPITYIHCNWACDGDSNGFFLPTSYFSDVLQYDSPNHNFYDPLNETIRYYSATKNIIVHN